MHIFCHSLSIFSLQNLRKLAKILGSFAYIFHAPRRKITLANLKRSFPHISSKEHKKIARASFQNLAIVLFEVCWFFKRRSQLIECITLREEADVFSRLKEGKGVIFFGGHQANWELIFPVLNRYFQGIVIGKPFKNNSWLYNFLLSFRQMNGGKVVHPKNAIQESLKTLQNGKWVLFADHKFRRSSNYTYPLFGHPAYTSLAPSLLAYRTNNPIVVITGKRTEQGYTVTFSSMHFPNLKIPFKQEAPRLMDRAMKIMEEALEYTPNDWMWMHNRWKIPIKKQTSL